MAIASTPSLNASTRLVSARASLMRRTPGRALPRRP